MAGIFAARRQGKIADRSVVMLGLASSSIPDFVSSVILQALIGVKLGWFHVIAKAPDGASIPTQLAISRCQRSPSSSCTSGTSLG